jgi:hypothetical protein
VYAWKDVCGGGCGFAMAISGDFSFKSLSIFFIFFLGGSEVIYGNGINLGYDGKMEGFPVHLIFILFGCRENVGKGEKVRILFFSFVFILLWYW